jgi:GTP cyclohydrolase I
MANAKEHKVFDEVAIRKAVANIIKAIGEDPDREGLKDTPSRVAEMYGELFMGVNIDARAELTQGYELGHREMIIVRDIPFYSMCEHHLLPFYGVAHIGYIPDVSGRVVGISKLARVVEIIARRPQIQERMTTTIADDIMAGLHPSGVGVVVQAEHMCMIMRGIKKPGSAIITSAVRGIFRSRPATRAEFFSLIQK